jgi:hypothetical protein
LKKNELAFYLQTGNLPDRYVQQRVGAGRPRRKNARAAIVSRVMRERCCSLPEASRFVKQNGLY